MNDNIGGNVESELLANVNTSSRFQHMLIRMLQEQGNSSIIEWVDGHITIHHPKKLESNVLSKYFNHSKYTSFQRQLNNFGFRQIKQARKDRVGPCVYTNKSTTLDILSIMNVRRATNRKYIVKKPKLNKYEKLERKLPAEEPKMYTGGSNQKILVFDTPICSNSNCKCCSIINEILQY